jgi:hypothetical protein
MPDRGGPRALSRDKARHLGLVTADATPARGKPEGLSKDPAGRPVRDSSVKDSSVKGSSVRA